MEKNILLITYVFPPYPGIGGRRWAKFAKYLHRKGQNVYVIAAQNPFDNVSTFINDISEIPKENIFYLPPKYPAILLKQPKTFLEKLQYHFWIRTLPFFTDGNFYDRSIFWKKQLQQNIRQLIKDKNIHTIIVSGPPFHLVYETIQLKKEFPHIKFIADYRDEWTFNEVHGFGIIGNKRQKAEFEKEKFVCENADVVMSCHKPILEYLQEKYYSKHLYLLNHGFDKDDLMFQNDKSRDDKIIISYFGTIQPNTENFYVLLNQILTQLKIQNPNIYNKLQLNFYLISPFLFQNIISENKDKFNFYYNLDAGESLRHISESDFILLVLSKRAKDYFTSKFPEVFYLKKPIILYSEKGRVSEFIEKNNIGVHLPQTDFYDVFVNAIQHKDKFQYNNFDLKQWDYEYLTDKLIELL